MCGEGGYNARGGGDREMREWRGGPEVICHSPPSFASPRPRLHLPTPVHISPPPFTSPGPRSCVVCPLVCVLFVPPFAAVVSATPAAAVDVDVAVAVAAAVRMPALALSCRWWFTHSPFVCSPTGGSCWQPWGWLTTEHDGDASCLGVFGADRGVWLREVVDGRERDGGCATFLFKTSAGNKQNLLPVVTGTGSAGFRLDLARYNMY
jgi:hypothetical protein